MIDIGNVRLEFSGYTQEEIEDIQEGLHILYSTRAGTVPLDRNFGIDMSCLEKELGIAQTEYTIEVISKTDEYEPRVKVSEVVFNVGAKAGVIYPTIKLEKGDEEGEF